MNSQHRAIRALLTTMPPKRAIEYVQAFELPADEEYCVIQREVRKKSLQQIAQELNLSQEAVKDRRRWAFGKMAGG
jgi:DNA-directed RNA polymerase specialized sigma24 family protein